MFRSTYPSVGFTVHKKERETDITKHHHEETGVLVVIMVQIPKSIHSMIKDLWCDILFRPRIVQSLPISPFALFLCHCEGKMLILLWQQHLSPF